MQPLLVEGLDKVQLLRVSLALFIVFIGGLFTSPRAFYKPYGGDRICIAVTIPPQVEFVERIGGDRVYVTVMVPPGYNPHTYEPRVSQLRGVSVARIYFQVGSGVEFELAQMDRLRSLNRDMLVVNCSRGVRIVDGDPHVWLSPRNVKVMIENIYEALVQVDPANEEYYRRNMEAYLRELDELDRDIRLAFMNVTNRRFMVYHPSWGYFARDYNLTQIPIESEGKEPTPAGLAALVDQARRLNIKVVIVSPQFDFKKAETIAEEIGGRVIFADPLAKDYLDNLRKFAFELAGSMG